ncbi:diacylglycerol kinase [Cryobacterium frigoriphilum]|uniref:Diacylglycerol kinase n=2 Tax=Cryobacterium frigoriphilum TaxID=1259150 RepID=A0A4V3IRP0_9MICO|nr:diacylglycerol kinase [Cryobacterium frigoriphilum]
MKFAAVIYNPIKVDLAALREVVDEAEHDHGWSSSLWLSTSTEDAGQERAAEAVQSGASVVIVAGGDGTVRAVAEGLQSGSIPLALLPSGTGNLLARNLGIPLNDVAAAVTIAFTGDVHRIDVGRITVTREDQSESSHVFVVMAGLGLDAKMLANTDDDLKKKAGWLAYVTALATTLRDPHELRFRYSLNGGQQRSLRAHTLIVANCGALPSNIVLLPDAEVDDGQFDIALLRPTGVIGWVQIFFKVIWENGVLRRSRAGRAFMTKEVSALRYVKATQIGIRLARAEQIELDGDGFGSALAFEAQIDPKALSIMFPRS